MLARTLLAAATIALGMIAAPMSAQAADTAAYDRLLTRYVVASPDGINRVRYTAWAANAGDIDALNAYVASLEQDRPSRMTRDERLAHWINLYNAVTLQIILENYPVRSIRDIRSQTLDPRGLIGPWRTQRVTVEGRRLTLDQIENSILRPEFNEPRIHYAINCAFGRLAKKTSKDRLCLYAYRHSFGHRQLTEGTDSLVVATLMGHSDLSMLHRVYGHIHQNKSFLLAQLNK